MNSRPKILAFAGSLRKDSLNKKLIKLAAKSAEKAGADVTVIDLADYPLPMYDEDIEKNEGLPENAKKLKKLMWDHQGFLIASPEYNSSISGCLKNVIDWTSRQLDPKEVYLSCFIGKTASLMSASPGNLGGLRGLVTLRSILGNVNTLVLPTQKSISQAHEAFKEDGSLKDAKHQDAIDKQAKELVELLKKL